MDKKKLGSTRIDTDFQKLKTKYRFIHFVLFKNSLVHGDYYSCLNNRSCERLCDIEYDGQWKTWVMASVNPNAIFSIDCLRDIADFVAQLNLKEGK